MACKFLLPRFCFLFQVSITLLHQLIINLCQYTGKWEGAAALVEVGGNKGYELVNSPPWHHGWVLPDGPVEWCLYLLYMGFKYGNKNSEFMFPEWKPSSNMKMVWIPTIWSVFRWKYVLSRWLELRWMLKWKWEDCGGDCGKMFGSTKRSNAFKVPTICRNGRGDM